MILIGFFMAMTKKQRRRLMPPRTWKELKEAMQALGVKDDDEIWALDVGPFRGKLSVDRDKNRVEVTDDCTSLMD